MRTDSDRGVLDEALPVRPSLAGDVRVHPPRGEGDQWIVERDGRNYYRVGPDMAGLAQLLTGEYDQDELLGMLGERWTEEGLHRGLTKLRDMSLLEDGKRRSTAPRRIAVVPPMSVQISVLDPSRVLERIVPVIRLLGRRPAQLLCWALALGGFVALAVSADDVERLIGSPVPVDVLVPLFVGGVLGLVIHELSHGATLFHFGARPRRMGVMLFYLLPAFFCDVSDGWLLSQRGQRVRVALAGVFAQFVVAGTAGVVAVALPGGLGRDGLLLLAMTTYVAGVVNLVPFVKLDGYLALMSLLDIPNLRAQAMDDARNFLAHMLYGARRLRVLPGRWIAPYGLACMAVPVYLIGGVAFTLWADALQGTGLFGATMILGFLGGLVFAVGRGFVHLQQAARAAGAPLARLILVDVVLVAGLAVTLSGVTVAEEVPGNYRVADGEVQLVVATSAATDGIRPGQRVDLRTNGVILRRPVGTARVGESDPRPASVPMSDVLPLVVDTGLEVEVLLFPLEDAGTPEFGTGVARVSVGERSLGGWLWSRYVEPLTRLS